MSQVYEFGPFRLDSRSASLSRAGREIHLTAKAYSTLLFLVERAGWLVSKDEILATIWPNGFVEPANLTQTVYVVRKALGDANGQLIETVPNRGYRFTASLKVLASSNLSTHQTHVAAKPWWAQSAAFAVLAAATMLLLWAYGLRGSTSTQVVANVNPTAQRDYVLGRHYWSQRTLPGIKEGLHYFKAALALDPAYAQATSGVADSYSALGYYSPYGPKVKQYFDDSRATALHAILLDQNSAEAHASLAFADEFLGKAYAKDVVHEFRRSIALDGKYATAREWYSWYLFGHGQIQAAVAQMLQARTLDPLSPVINFAVGYQLYYDRRFDASAQQWHFVTSIAPNDEQSYFGAGLADEAAGDAGRAERELEHAIAIAPGDPDAIAALAHTYARARNPGAAFRLLARIADMKPVPAYDIAVVKEALGQQNQAIHWLSVARAGHDANLRQLRIDPRMDKVRAIWLKHFSRNL